MANLSDREREAYPAREGVAASSPRQHNKCVKKLEHAMKRSEFLSLEGRITPDTDIDSPYPAVCGERQKEIRAFILGLISCPILCRQLALNVEASCFAFTS